MVLAAKKTRQVKHLAVIIPTVVAVLMLLPLFLSYLWNTTMPDIFGLPTVGYWQMFRLFLLVTTFTGGTRVITQEATPPRREYVLTPPAG